MEMRVTLFGAVGGNSFECFLGMDLKKVSDVVSYENCSLCVTKSTLCFSYLTRVKRKKNGSETTITKNYKI